MAKAMGDYGLKWLERVFQKEADHRFFNWIV